MKIEVKSYNDNPLAGIELIHGKMYIHGIQVAHQKLLIQELVEDPTEEFLDEALDILTQYCRRHDLNGITFYADSDEPADQMLKAIMEQRGATAEPSDSCFDEVTTQI